MGSRHIEVNHSAISEMDLCLNVHFLVREDRAHRLGAEQQRRRPG